MAASLSRFWGSVRDLPRAYAVPSLLAGLLVVIVVFSGPVLIIVQAATAGNLTEAQTTSWIWAVVIGAGAFSVIMSLWYRMPVKAAWSTPGAVLLISSLALYPYSEAIGAFIIAAIATILLGITGWFSRVLRLVPNAVIMGMLAGVLLRYGTGLFSVLPDNTVMIALMIIVFYILKRVGFRIPTLGALAVGLIVAALSGQLNIPPITLTITQPTFTAPTFTLEALLGIAVPLFALSITTQDAPGVAVLKSYGYAINIDSALIFTGIGSLLLAPFGCSGLNLAAITAAMVANPEAHRDPNKRYTAGVSIGLFYLLLGTFSAAAVALFTALPAALVAGVAGLSLLGTIINGTTQAVEDSATREAGMIALLCTAANFTLFGIGAAFWGLVFGVLVHVILTARRGRDS
jgi:benzoate membrane transport protein